MWRQTSGWVACAKPSNETLTQVFLTHFVGVFQNKATQNNLAMLYRKFLRKQTQLSDVLSEFVIFLKLGSCGESWTSFLPIFLMFHRTDFGGFLVCCYKAIQQLNGVEKNSVAISLMLNHNLTGLLSGFPYVTLIRFSVE